MMLFFLMLASIFGLGCDCTTIPSDDRLVFSIMRNVNNDKIIYVINKDARGFLSAEEPISLCWIYSKNKGSIDDVPYIKKKFGYGVEVLERSDDYLKFKFVSYDDLTFEIKKNQSGEFKAYVDLHNNPMELHDIFVNIDGGTFWKPNVTQVYLSGLDKNSQKPISLPLFQ